MQAVYVVHTSATLLATALLVMLRWLERHEMLRQEKLPASAQGMCSTITFHYKRLL